MTVRQWLLFLPQTPSVPSSLRVSVWRRMHQLGAIALQNGVWIFPRNDELEKTLHLLQKELEIQGGGGFLLITQAASAQSEEQIVARFREERKQDYDEFIDRCQQFLDELDKETKVQKFTFAELEENEEDLHKLTLWLRKLHHRDFFGGPQLDATTVALAQCRSALEQFTTQVYRRQGYEPPDVSSGDGEVPQES